MRIKGIINDLQDYYLLALKALAGVFSRPLYFMDTIEQMDYAGAGSFIIIVLVAVFIGMALSLQLSAEFARLGLKMYTGKAVGITIIREVGPVMAALVFTGRVGAGMASELGSMVLGHQVDSLRAFGVDPVKKLVTPRLISSIIMLPVLTIIGDALSILGAYYIVVFVSNQSGYVYWRSIRDVLISENIIAGSIKPFIFGFLIASISCYSGLTTRGGAAGLREATTRAVVLSIISIIISDFALTRILLYMLGFSV
jgi:phospholipid/cholesterol/gamma-HCH transport system permease protein